MISESAEVFAMVLYKEDDQTRDCVGKMMKVGRRPKVGHGVMVWSHR